MNTEKNDRFKLKDSVDGKVRLWASSGFGTINHELTENPDTYVVRMDEDVTECTVRRNQIETFYYMDADFNYIIDDLIKL